MDFKNIHGQDVSNFSSSSPHRMPTVSAAQALSQLKSSPKRLISTGIPQLDLSLQNQDTSSIATEGVCHGGVSRGHVTEIYGPPGVGKTAIGMQLAVNVLVDGGKVAWIDAAHLLPGPRLKNILSSSIASRQSGSSTSQQPFSSSMLRNLAHVTAPSLPHLLALISQNDSSFPAVGTSLIIIDSLSTLINSAFPKTNNSTSTPRKSAAGAQNQPNKQDAARWASTRKWTVLQHLISTLSKIAALKNIAVVILQQTATKMRDGAGAILVPSISSTAWDAGIASRIVLFQDWGLESGKESIRYAGVLKAEGILGPSNGGIGRVVPFTIQESGIVPTILPSSTPQTEEKIVPPASNRKRKLEIGDSEGEDALEDSDDDYGWDEEDEANVLDPPPQTQGSEDILMPGPAELEKDEDEVDEATSRPGELKYD